MSDPAQVLANARTIAVVGASSTPGKAANEVPQVLIAAGWDVIPVNPAQPELYGRPCYPTLADVDRPIDLVDVFRPPAQAAGVAAEAVAVGAGGVWLQLGITSVEARRITLDAGLDYVEDACTAIVARMPGVAPQAPGGGWTSAEPVVHSTFRRGVEQSGSSSGS